MAIPLHRAAVIRRLVTLPLQVAIRGYQYLLSPVMPASCRYQPTCSAYAIAAIGHHGPLRGLWLAARRIARCQPWGGHGYDPVPDASAGHAQSRRTQNRPQPGQPIVRH